MSGLFEEARRELGDEFISGMGVDLLYEATPEVDEDALLRELRRRCGRVEWASLPLGAHLCAFPAHMVQYQDARVPAGLVLTPLNKGAAELDLEEALHQTWHFGEAREAVARCRAALVLAEVRAFALERKTRLTLFHSVVESVLTVAPCRAIWWVKSQQIVDASAYLRARRSGRFHPFQFAQNVRLYGLGDGEPGDTLMDTRGLAPLGLADLQCHFRGLDPRDVARVLTDYAFHLFDHGDVIEDGDTIDGVGTNKRWICRHEMAMAKPVRPVIDINPGPPFAAGIRQQNRPL